MSRVYEQSEVDALVAAAEEAGYRACIADVKKENSELDLFLYQGLPTYKGALARHDAELIERLLNPWSIQSANIQIPSWAKFQRF